MARNRLWRLGCSVDRLADLGLRLGADVPVFVRGHAAWAEGVGERLTPLDGALAPRETVYLILKPNVSVATAAVFQDPELTRNSSPITIAGFLSSGGRNDCEPIVRRRYPEVARALDWLGAFGTARQFTDQYASTYTQGLALAALAAAGVRGTPQVAAAVSWLVGQQCPTSSGTSACSASSRLVLPRSRPGWAP